MSAAIVPPPDVRAEIERIVAAADLPPDSPTPWWRRWWGSGHRAAGEQPTSSAAHRELDVVPADTMHLPLTAFGNVTAGDVGRLVTAVRAEAAAWPTPTVYFHGGTALEFPGDENVWAMLAGDLEALKAVGAGVPPVVRALGFLVDRRQFRTWMPVGSITDRTTAPYLEALVGRLDAHTSRTWVVDHISVVRRAPAGNAELEELERISLGRS